MTASRKGTAFGPMVGAGLGYQFTPCLRLVAEGDYAIDSIFMSLTSVFAELQYSFS